MKNKICGVFKIDLTTHSEYIVKVHTPKVVKVYGHCYFKGSLQDCEEKAKKLNEG